MNLAKLRAQNRMRSLAGHTIARQGTGADGYMRKYMTYRASGGRCMESGDAEGKAARPRLDRPGRKAGGRACKADGGAADDDKSPPNPGEKSNTEQAKYLRRKAIHAGIDSGLSGLTSGIGAAGALMRGIGPAKLFRTGMGAASLSSGIEAKKKWDEASQSASEAKEFDKADGKKWGGRARMHKSGDHDEDDKYAKGGKLTANARKHIAPKNFALRGGRYPIEDASHARNALSRVSANGTSEEKAKVRSAVHRKYPGIGKD